MKYVITIDCESHDMVLPSMEFKKRPLLPAVGDGIRLGFAGNDVGSGEVLKRAFSYDSNACFVTLKCEKPE
jgi:hypothetical protein